MDSLGNIYRQRLAQYTEQLKQLDRKVLTISLTRVGLFLLICVALYRCTIVGFQGFWLIAFVLGIVGFMGFIVVHQRFIVRQQLSKALERINQQELDYVEQQKLAYDGGEKFDSPDHEYASDLDLFGDYSIFASVNRTVTEIGREALARLFKMPLKSTKSIEQQQKAVQVLAPQTDWRQTFMAWGLLHGQDQDVVAQLSEWVDTDAEFRGKTAWTVLRFLMPLVAISTLLIWVFLGYYQPLVLLMLVNVLILRTKVMYINKEHALIGKRQEELKKYARLLAQAPKHDCADSGVLRDLQKEAKAASEAIEKLTKIANAFDQRLNIFVMVLLNLTGLYDVHCVHALEVWKGQHKDKLLGWLNVLAKYDVLNSLATYVYNHSDYTFPKVTKSEALYIRAKDLAHPLILSETRVSNNVDLGQDGKLYIITGSNMSGKSTFLRSVAINLLFARCGLPVCASDMECSLMDIMTSMRVKDSVAQQVSYFQAELIRLQQLIRQLQTGKPAFIVLDEVLKGTNSEDKLLGSQLLVRRFLHFNCLGMIATHDLDLGRTESKRSADVKNLCFESRIEQDELIFDYTLNKGIAQNKNATFLLRKMGIVEKEI